MRSLLHVRTSQFAEQLQFCSFVALASPGVGYSFLSRCSSKVGTDQVPLHCAVYHHCLYGALWLTIIHNTPRPWSWITVLLWLLAYTWLMQRRYFPTCCFRLKYRVLFWLFFVYVILFENRKTEETPGGFRRATRLPGRSYSEKILTSISDIDMTISPLFSPLKTRLLAIKDVCEPEFRVSESDLIHIYTLTSWRACT